MKVILTDTVDFISSAVIRQYINDIEQEIINLDTLTRVLKMYHNRTQLCASL
ncbi:hypothetical protein MNBD_GAMMA05-1566 [hydrothermal vent metagenome]|uniref:Uncharacterized protein n=1 Tax=hydrothermal vent metagenome TaxID=652676 RepID=A0A3B0WMU7_9ZZZZ